MQSEVKKFKTNILAMYKDHLKLITALPADTDDEEEEEYETVEVYEDDDIEATKVINTADLRLND